MAVSSRTPRVRQILALGEQRRKTSRSSWLWGGGFALLSATASWLMIRLWHQRQLSHQQRLLESSGPGGDVVPARDAANTTTDAHQMGGAIVPSRAESASGNDEVIETITEVIGDDTPVTSLGVALAEAVAEAHAADTEKSDDLAELGAISDMTDQEESEASDDERQARYVGNRKTFVLHRENRGRLPAEENRIYFETLEAALHAGYHLGG